MIDWRHNVSEEKRSVGLDKKESGQAPNASDKTERQTMRWTTSAYINNKQQFVSCEFSFNIKYISIY
jgi:hypothetical protein